MIIKQNVEEYILQRTVKALKFARDKPLHALTGLESYLTELARDLENPLINLRGILLRDCYVCEIKLLHTIPLDVHVKDARRVKVEPLFPSAIEKPWKEVNSNFYRMVKPWSVSCWFYDTIYYGLGDDEVSFNSAVDKTFTLDIKKLINELNPVSNVRKTRVIRFR